MFRLRSGVRNFNRDPFLRKTTAGAVIKATTLNLKRQRRVSLGALHTSRRLYLLVCTANMFNILAQIKTKTEPVS